MVDGAKKLKKVSHQRFSTRDDKLCASRSKHTCILREHTLSHILY